MSEVVRAPHPITIAFSSIQQSKTPKSRVYINPLGSIPGSQLCSSNLNLKFLGFEGAKVPPRSVVQCNSSSRPGPPGSGDSDNRNMLDAFFLGKALAEAVNDRVESTIGEFLSAIGRLQAEQQKQVQGFQEEVLERAKRAKEKAAREALEAQGLISKSTTVDTSVTNGFTSATSFSTTNAVTPANSSSSVPTAPAAGSNLDPANDPGLGVSNDD